MVVFLLLCLCGGAFVVVFLCWCFCAGVFVAVFLWWCFCAGVSCGVVAVVWWRWCSSGGVFVVVFLWWCTKYCSSTTEYYSVLQSTTPYSKVLLQYYSNITLYYKVLLQYYSALQSTTPTSETMSERRPSSTTPYYASTTKASKTSISCEASATFQGTSFQNEHFGCFRQFSQKKLPKGSFRARLPPNFTEEEASKTSVSCEASFKFHRTMLPKRAFRTMLPTILQEKASKMIVSCEASSKFHRTSFQNERFARCFRQFSRKICVSLQFRAIDTPLPARGFIRQKQNVPRTTTPCIPKFQNVRFATAACTKMYESIHREPTRFAHTKM